MYNRAIEAGATSLGEPADRPYGERSGFVKDAAGNYWYIATRFPSNVSPEGAGSVLPYAHPAKALPFIDFLKRAFGAQEMGVYQQERPRDARRGPHRRRSDRDGRIARLPAQQFLPVTSRIATRCIGSAIEAGATSLWPPTDQAWGDRTAGLVDPFGYQWMPSAQIKDVR